MIILNSVFLIALVAVSMIGVVVPNIMDVDAATACSLTHMNEFIMKSAEPRICERVNYWVHYECGRIPGMYLTDERCQPPAGFPLEKLASFGSFMELNLDKEIYKMGDAIQVYGNVYSSVGLPTENLGIRITNSDGQKILEQKANFDGFGKFAFKILTGTTISINDEGNYELHVVHYGKYGSSAIKKFTVSNDGLPIVIPTVVTPLPTPVPTVVTPLPTPVPTQDPEPFTTSWSMIAGLLIVVAVVGGIIYKKVAGLGISRISTNYSNTKDEHDNDSSTAEEPSDNSQQNKNPVHPTYADLKNNFRRYSWEDAEDLTALLFKAKGYSAKVGVPSKDGGRKRNGDFGIDVRANNGIVNIGIQVKHQEKDVDFDAVAKTLGVAQKFQKVIIVSTKSGFSAQSLEHAGNNPDDIELWDSDKFKEEIRKHLIEKDNHPFEDTEQTSDFNYYEILGANRNDTQDEIKRKYKELSLKFHPDKAKSALSENMMKQVNEAYAVLRDVDKRRQYDLELDSA